MTVLHHASKIPDFITNAPTGHLILQLLTGAAAAQSCLKYPFASYYLYVPTIHPMSKQKVGQPPQSTLLLPVVVIVHGSGRDAAEERDRWAAFGEEHGCLIVAPLFPIDMSTVLGVDNYKNLVYTPKGCHPPLFYDQVLLQILQEVHDVYGYVDVSKFNLVGFSGGGQFAHRFFYLHPGRLKSISIGAPGNATYLDPHLPWPIGIQDVPEKFDGFAVRLEALRLVPVQLYVGSVDIYHTVNYDGTRAPVSRYGVIERLHRDFDTHGIDHVFHVEPGVAHRGDLLLHLTQPFVLEHLL